MYLPAVFSLLAPVDSGADDSFLDEKLASQVGIHTVPLDSPISVNALNGKFLAQITHRTVPLLLVLCGYHREYIQLNIIFSPTSLVLGLTWLRLHNPH